MNEASEAQLTGERQKQKRPPRSAAEWMTFSVASVLLGIIAGLVIYSWATERDRPPSFSLSRTEPIRRENNQFYIPFEIVNTGGETAESVQVVAELKRNGRVEETGDLQIDFLASDEREKGAFVFTQNPQGGELVLRVSSYKVP